MRPFSTKKVRTRLLSSHCGAPLPGYVSTQGGSASVDGRSASAMRKPVVSGHGFVYATRRTSSWFGASTTMALGPSTIGAVTPGNADPGMARIATPPAAPSGRYGVATRGSRWITYCPGASRSPVGLSGDGNCGGSAVVVATLVNEAGVTSSIAVDGPASY